MSFPFWKYHGAGNDFILVEGDAGDWSRLAPALCDRRHGIGGDGVLVLLPSAAADVRMRMFNPDGTEDDCGNGLRCLAFHALHAGQVNSPTFFVETLTAIKPVAVEVQTGCRAAVTADMGRADLYPAAVPARFDGNRVMGVALDVAGETLSVHSLWTGSAHTVLFAMPDEARFRRLSPLLEHHPAYPKRTTVLWTEVVSRTEARVRIWERGVGETLACGTGACAVATAAWLTGRTGARVKVVSGGGSLEVEVGDDLSLRMRGPAERTFSGRWTGPALRDPTPEGRTTT